MAKWTTTACPFEADPIIFDGGAADGGDIAAHGLRVATAICEQIEVDGRPVWLIRP
jgi:hypothetical protein